MATNERVTQVAPEVLNSGTDDQRVTHLPVEVLNAGTDDQRVTQVAVEVLTAETAPAFLRVTQAGAAIASALGEQLVTQVGAHAARQKDELRVTQVGLRIVSLPPGGGGGNGGGGEEEACILDIPSVERWADGTPSIACVGDDPSSSASLWSPMFGATSAISSQYFADRFWAPRYWGNYWGASVEVQLEGECVIDRPSVSLWSQTPE